jgi:hypothetical protein
MKTLVDLARARKESDSVVVPCFCFQNGRTADIVHWNDYDRNEVGSSCRASGDIHLYNFRTRGRTGDDASPSTILTNKQVSAVRSHAPMPQFVGMKNCEGI